MPPSKNIKQKQYDKQLEYFGKEFSSVTKYELFEWQKSYIERIKKNLLDKNFKDKLLIDVATGSGYVAIEMAKIGMKVIATDLTPEAISNLERYKEELKLTNLTIKRSYAEKIDLKTSSVDYLVANAILEHIPSEKDAISEWKRITKPGGKLFITTPLRYRYIYPFLWLPNVLHDKKIGHLRRYSLKDYVNKFKLPVLKVYYTGHFVKIAGIIISIILKNSKYDKYFEKTDTEQQHIAYGANNISVILKNVK